jgi:hypothetical protein
MSYMYVFAALGAGGLLWLLVKSKQLTVAKDKLTKQRKVARAQFLRGADAGPKSEPQSAASRRPKFGQR